MQKPVLTIDIIAPEGNVYPMIEKARMTLEQAGHIKEAKELGDWFYALPLHGSGVTYDDVRKKIEEYCDVTWLNDEPMP